MDMPTMRVRIDVILLREKGEMSILKLRKDVMLLREMGTWLY